MFIGALRASNERPASWMGRKSRAQTLRPGRAGLPRRRRENFQTVCKQVCQGLGWLRFEPEPTRNEKNAMSLGTKTSCVRMVVIPTNEEIVIVRGPATSPLGYALGKGVRA